MVASIDIDFHSYWDPPPFFQHVGFVERGLSGRAISRERRFPGHLCFFRVVGEFGERVVESERRERRSIGSDIRSLRCPGGNTVVAPACDPAPGTIPTSIQHAV